MLKESYTSANAIPWKLLRFPMDKIKPLHLQLIPTNRCNANCPWCSCKNVDRHEELSYQDIINILNKFKILGTIAVTITGGGEPTLHPDFEAILNYISMIGLKSGLVTNGINIKDKSAFINDNCTWVRLSIINTQKYDVAKINYFCNLLPDVDVGISYTVTDSPNLELVMQVVNTVQDIPNLTHVRFVQDLYSTDSRGIELVENVIKGYDKIITKRNDYQAGASKCYLSQLKPEIGADGYVYPCCGVQYALGEDKCLPKSMRISHWSNYEGLQPFNGSVCKVCYFENYNTFLKQMVNKPEHLEFV